METMIAKNTVNANDLKTRKRALVILTDVHDNHGCPE